MGIRSHTDESRADSTPHGYPFSHFYKRKKPHWRRGFNLSDEGIKDAVYDSYTFRKFMEIDFNEEQVFRNTTTLLKFRHLLKKSYWRADGETGYVHTITATPANVIIFPKRIGQLLQEYAPASTTLKSHYARSYLYYSFFIFITLKILPRDIVLFSPCNIIIQFILHICKFYRKFFVIESYPDV